MDILIKNNVIKKNKIIVDIGIYATRILDVRYASKKVIIDKASMFENTSYDDAEGINFDDIARLVINGKEIPQCYWYDHEISKRSIATIRYCKADVQATFDLYRRKVETNMKEEMEQKIKNIKLFFNVWCPRANDVLFILLKDGRHDYYDYIKTVNISHYGYLYIENVDGCYEKIDYKKG